MFWFSKYYLPLKCKTYEIKLHKHVRNSGAKIFGRTAYCIRPNGVGVARPTSPKSNVNSEPRLARRFSAPREERGHSPKPSQYAPEWKIPYNHLMRPVAHQLEQKPSPRKNVGAYKPNGPPFKPSGRGGFPRIS